MFLTGEPTSELLRKLLLDGAQPIYNRELLLITGLSQHGIGNWKKIAEHVGTRTKEEVEAHYNQVYIHSPDWPLPVSNFLLIRVLIGDTPQPMNLEFDVDPEDFHERKRRRISAMNAMLPPPPKVAPTSAPGIHEIATFLPGRLEFEHELDNDAEDLVKDLEFGVCLAYGGDQLPEDEEDADVQARSKWKEEQKSGLGASGSGWGKTLPTGKGTQKVPKSVNGKTNGYHGNGNSTVVKQEPKSEANGNTSQDEEAEEPTQPPPYETEESLKFKLTMMEAYMQRVGKRLEGKAFIFNRGLLEYKKTQAAEKKRPREERDIVHRLRPFAKLQTAEDFEAFTSDILYESTLRKRISELQTYRRLGLVTGADIEKYEADLAKRTQAKANPPRDDRTHVRSVQRQSTGPDSRRDPESIEREGTPRLPVSAPPIRRPPAPLNLANSPSLHLLTPGEQALCSHLRILPKPYLAIKEILVREYARRGGKLRRREARDLVKIDVNKTSRIWDFLVQAGFLKINNDQATAPATDSKASAIGNASPVKDAQSQPPSSPLPPAPAMATTSSTGSLNGSLYNTSMASTPTIATPWPPQSQSGTLKQQNKRFKSKHATKSSLKDAAKGRVARSSLKSSTTNASAQTRLDRRNNAKQAQVKKRSALISATRVFSGVDGAPRIVAIIPLCPDVDPKTVVSSLAESLDVSADDCPQSGLWKMKYVDLHFPIFLQILMHNRRAERFKTSLQFIIVPYGNFYASVDACKVADYVTFALSTSVEVDTWGDTLLRTLQAQGLPDVVTLAASNPTIDPKARPGILKSLLSFIQYFAPTQGRIFDMHSSSDRLNALRALSEGKPADVRWREGRSWVLGESAEWEDGRLKVTGVVRGSSLSPHRLVHLPNFGDFQIEKILSAALPRHSKSGQTGSMDIEPTLLAEPNADDADSLVSSNDPDDLANEQTWPTEEEMNGNVEFEETSIPDVAENVANSKHARRVPKGTSAYQASWILDESDEDDDEDVGGKDEAEEVEMEEFPAEEDMQDMPVDDDMESERKVTFEDLDNEEEERQLNSWRNRQREEEDDLQFPDEMDTPKDIPALTRFQRFRGMRSFRTSPWDPFENLPRDYARIFQFEDFRRTERSVRRRAEQEITVVEPGTRVTVYLKDVPQEAAISGPVTLFALLQHEHNHQLIRLGNLSLRSNPKYPLINIKARSQTYGNPLKRIISSAIPLVPRKSPTAFVTNNTIYAKK
ncbi:hypothetical protein H0H93_011116 [Arthromyces matolae]|nr:hypothetical protein H0H93_011116 [Arthromyces matolae]